MRSLLGTVKGILEKAGPLMLLHIGRYHANGNLGHTALAEDVGPLPLPGTDDGYGANDQGVANRLGAHESTEVGERLEGLNI